MAKGSGTTRTSTSSAPKGIAPSWVGRKAGQDSDIVKAVTRGWTSDGMGTTTVETPYGGAQIDANTNSDIMYARYGSRNMYFVTVWDKDYKIGTQHKPFDSIRDAKNFALYEIRKKYDD